MKKIYIQELNRINAQEELKEIGFDKSYLQEASKKYEFKSLKIFNLKAIEANILKQTALSLGSDCAVHKNVILNAEGEFDCLIVASIATLTKIANKLTKQQFQLPLIGDLILNSIKKEKNSLKIQNKIFNFKENKYIMGILNITPDSFSDGGKYFDEQSVTKHYQELESQGADIIDIGAQSTKPDFTEIGEEEEIRRLNLLFNSSTFKNIKILKSIDTYNYKVAQHAINNGIDIINDVKGFTDINMIKLAKDAQSAIVVMFNQKILPNTQKDTFSQMYEYFINKIEELVNVGINENKIILDCGFGFFKNNRDNFLLLNQLQNIQNFKLPILTGISRKSFLSSLTSENMDIDEITQIVTTKFIDNIDILRVHDVKKAKSIINISKKVSI